MGGKQLTGRRLQIAQGDAGIPLDRVVAYREKWAAEGYELPAIHQPLPDPPPQPSPPAPTGTGPGSQLHRIFQWWGIDAAPGCSCRKKSEAMDAAGVEWCRYNENKILEWITGEAKRRGFPVVQAVARRLIRLAVRRAAAHETPPPAHPLPPGVTRWAVGITAAARGVSKLPETVNTLRRAGFEPVIYAEPETNLGGLPYGVEIVQRETRLGCWRNYVQTLRDLYHRDTKADAVLVCQDDLRVAPYLRRFLEADLWPSTNVGCVSFYAPHFPGYEDDHRPDAVELKKINHRGMMGACALIYPRATVRRMLEHPLATEWRGAYSREEPDPVKKKAVDTWVGHITQALGCNNFFYIPSLCQHTAGTSAVGHGGNQQTKDLRGRRWHYRRSLLYREETPPGEIWDGKFYWGRWTLPAGHLRFAAEPATTPSRQVVAIIPGRGLPGLTVDCLRHLKASTIRRELRVVYVEDGPEPDWKTGEYHEIRRLVANIGGHCVALGDHGGYTAATNEGIRIAREHFGAAHLLLLNNDANVGPRCLEKLRWHLERHHRTAAVGPLTGDHGRQSVRNGHIQNASRIRTPDHNAQDGDRLAVRPLVWDFAELSGFCLMLHGDAVEELGALAVEGYPMGLGTDDEWIRRANRNGWRSLLIFEAWATHQHHQTFKSNGEMRQRRAASATASQTLRRT